MYSSQYFTPGRKSSAKKMIQYTAEYNRRQNEQNVSSCNCIGEYYNKNIVSSNNSSQPTPYNLQVSYICRTQYGGTTQFGNGGPVVLNYLGKMEGMPGGSGAPPRNHF
jgi:hypothetical protein